MKIINKSEKESVSFNNTKKTIKTYLEDFYNDYFSNPEKVDLVSYKIKINKIRSDIEKAYIEDTEFTNNQKEELKKILNDTIIELENDELEDIEFLKKKNEQSKRKQKNKYLSLEIVVFVITFSICWYFMNYRGY